MRSQLWSQQSLMERWNQFAGDWPSAPPAQTTPVNQSYSNDLLLSSNHHVSLLGKTRQDIGGAFKVVKRSYSEYSTLGDGRHHFSRFADPLGGASYGHFYGPQYARLGSFNNGNFPAEGGSSPATLIAKGVQAIARTSPTKPEFDGSSALGELFADGLPQMIGVRDNSKRRLSKARNAGDEYLNIEFGWKPLIRDLRQFARTVKNSERILDEFERSASKRIKRRYDWPVSTTYNVQTLSNRNAQPALSTNYYQNQGYKGTLKVTSTTETKQWFEGCYIFHLPPRKSSARKASELNKLYGVGVTPSTAWNLAPWSWAADWVGNTGENIDNLSSISNGLVILYAYVMEEFTATDEYQLTGIRYKSYSGSQTFRQTFTTTVKQRIGATPFGFGLSWDDFTPRQLAILAALGISRFG